MRHNILEQSAYHTSLDGFALVGRPKLFRGNHNLFSIRTNYGLLKHTYVSLNTPLQTGKFSLYIARSIDAPSINSAQLHSSMGEDL
jgi:hypothetical protein